MSLERHVTGLLTYLPRKNCEAIAAAVAGTSTERLQHLLTDAGRCARAGVPADVGFATKIDIALGLVDRAAAWGGPFAAVMADANDGSVPAFLDGLEARQLADVVAVDADVGLRWPEEVCEEVRASAAPPPPYGGRGRPRRTPLPPRHRGAPAAAQQFGVGTQSAVALVGDVAPSPTSSPARSRTSGSRPPAASSLWAITELTP